MRTLRPPAWAFGATPQQADELLALVLDGTKTATASSFDDYAAEGEDPPTPTLPAPVPFGPTGRLTFRSCSRPR